MKRLAAAFLAVFTLTSIAAQSLAPQVYRTTFDYHFSSPRGEVLRRERVTGRYVRDPRVHPHFLFNTLNSLSALIASKPVRAEVMVGRLAAILRSSLTLGGQRSIRLDQEMAVVRDYLAIEQERFGTRLQYDLSMSADAADCLVPPFGVQSLVENAVKHGVGPHEETGRIDVIAGCGNGELSIEVRDTGRGFDLVGVPTGHGLDNLTARLETSFGEGAGLEVSRRDDRCVVLMRLPIRRQLGAATA